ncbi:MAG TPA: HAMP domain-containing sensor histidine kinase [Candidatus Krumholzibacteria bacterium]|nr:HAMP domain-containing sensor histidine kinase [Candidatus Krumholzibacteria bacterium]
MDERTLYSQIFDAVRDPLMVVDAAGDVHAANASAIRFLDVAQDAGLFGPSEDDGRDTGSPVTASVLDLVRRRLTVRSHPLYASDGRDLDIVVDVEPLPGSAALLHFRSPTERLARELWSDDAVAAVAHEIKNPLSAMRSALDVVLKDPSAPLLDSQRRMLGAFDRSARRLARFVDGVLNVSRLHAGAAPAPRALVSVRALVEGVVDEYRALHPHKCPRLECEVAEAGARAFVDQDGAEIVLLNLLGNAARFSPSDAAVTVRASRAGVEAMEDDMRLVPWDVVGKPRLARIDVEDRGLGMTPDVLAHLFDRYHASDEGELSLATARDSGTHLGLHISRAIAEAHDGWLKVESSLGEGTVASVFVPEDEATARTLSRLRIAADSARRWQRAGRELAVVALAKASPESWEDLAVRWAEAPRVDPLASTCASRKALLWPIDDHLGVAIVPLAGGNDGPSVVLGEPVIRADEFAWGMSGFVAGWCRVEDATSFAQAFHKAASRMGRACAQIARGGVAEEAATPANAEAFEEAWEPVGMLPAMETTLHVENEE